MAVTVNGPPVERSDEVLTEDALEFVAGLHRRFGGTRTELLERRRERRAEVARTGRLGFLPDTAGISRSQVWQWVHGGVRLDTGEVVTRELVEELVAAAAVEGPHAQDARTLFAQDARTLFAGSRSTMSSSASLPIRRTR